MYKGTKKLSEWPARKKKSSLLPRLKTGRKGLRAQTGCLFEGEQKLANITLGVLLPQEASDVIYMYFFRRRAEEHQQCHSLKYLRENEHFGFSFFFFFFYFFLHVVSPKAFILPPKTTADSRCEFRNISTQLGFYGSQLQPNPDTECNKKRRCETNKLKATG